MIRRNYNGFRLKNLIPLDITNLKRKIPTNYFLNL